MKAKYLLMSIIIITFGPLLYSQIGSDGQLHIVLQDGKNTIRQVSDQFSIGSIVFEYYRIDNMVLSVSMNGRFEAIVNDESNRVQIFDKGKKIDDFIDEIKFAFFKEDGLITAGNNEITYYSLPKIRKVWSINIGEEICNLDSYNGKKGLIYVGTKNGFVYCYDTKGLLVKRSKVFENEQSSIMVTASNKLISVGRDAYVYEMKVIDFLDNTYENFTAQYDETGSLITEEKYIQKVKIENRYSGTEYYSPFVYADLRNHLYFLLYLNATGQLLLYDSSINEIVDNGSIQPNGVIAGFIGRNIIIADFLTNKVTILNTRLEISDSFRYEFGDMPAAYSISSIAYISGKAKLTFSKTNKYWK
jgi:hypothetical protein